MTYRPRSRIFVPAAATAQVVMLSEMKEHLRVRSDEEDDLIIQVTAAAVSAVEKATQRLLSQRQVVLHLPGLPVGRCPVELPGGVVASITSVIADAVPVTGATAYGDSPAILVPSADWPAVVGEGYPVVITYQAGYAEAPSGLVAAVKLIAGDLYRFREVSQDVAIAQAIVSADWLMAPYRIMAI